MAPWLRPLCFTVVVTFCFLVTLLGYPGNAAAAPAKRSIIWRSVVVHTDADAARWERLLRDLLTREGSRADWGIGFRPPAIATVDVRELRSDLDGDVARVTCTAVGRLEGGRSAKSTFHFGGSRQEKTKLERRVLQLVARGIVTRLAELSRATGRTKVNIEKTAGDF